MEIIPLENHDEAFNYWISDLGMLLPPQVWCPDMIDHDRKTSKAAGSVEHSAFGVEGVLWERPEAMR